MKTKVFMLVILMMMGAGSLFAKNKSEKFLVNGKCEMCENRIEMAALSVDGVSKANWNKETKEMNVTFNDAKTNLQSVQVAITKAGHDTDAIKATDEAYNDLPSGCKYDRSDLKAPMKLMEHKHQ